MVRVLGIVFSTILLCVNLQCFAKSRTSEKIEPKWVKTTPKSFHTNQRFIVVVDNGYSLKDIEDKKFDNLVNYIEKEVITSGSITTNSTKYTNNSHIDFVTSVKADKYHQTQIDEYWKLGSSGRYTHYYLYSISTEPGVDKNYKLQIKSSYGGRGLWRSMIVPGWGQFYKGSNLKGGLILGGTVAFAGAIIATEGVRQSYQQKIGQTYDVSSITYYSDLSNTMQTARNVCIGGAVALYVYNLIDAIVAPGAKYVKVKRVKMSPYASRNNNGMIMSYNF